MSGDQIPKGRVLGPLASAIVELITSADAECRSDVDLAETVFPAIFATLSTAMGPRHFRCQVEQELKGLEIQ